MSAALIAASLITLHAPRHTRVDLNPAEVVMLREPKDAGLIAREAGAGCVIVTADGRFVSVVETCAQVRAQWPR